MANNLEAHSGLFRRFILLTFAFVCVVSLCPGDSINSPDAGTMASATGTTETNYEGYFLDPATGYAALPDLGQLGLTAGTFLFSPNTMFAFNGTATFSILSANVDPSLGVIPLNDPTTQLLSFSVPGTGSSQPVSNSPEPHAIYLVIAGVSLLGVSAFRRARDW